MYLKQMSVAGPLVILPVQALLFQKQNHLKRLYQRLQQPGLQKEEGDMMINGLRPLWKTERRKGTSKIADFGLRIADLKSEIVNPKSTIKKVNEFGEM